MTSRITLAISIALACAACTNAPVIPARAAGATGTLAVAARPGYQLQAVPAAILPFAKRYLSAVQVRLLRDGAIDPDEVRDLTPAQLDQPLRFSGLAGGARYRIEVRAWQPADAAGGASAVAQVDAGSVTAFTALAGEDLDLDAQGGIKLTLADRVFDGRGTGGITLTSGVLGSTPAGEGIKR